MCYNYMFWYLQKKCVFSAAKHISTEDQNIRVTRPEAHVN